MSISLPIHDVRRFRRSNLTFTKADDQNFRHNYDRDLHLFVVWQDARHKAGEILSDLDSTFLIRSAMEIEWSDAYVVENTNRLYKKVQTGSTSLPAKIGDGRFVAIIVEDPEPVYAFDQTVSGLIECVNLEVVRHKKRYRGWFESPYAVHSTNSLGEFFEQAPLLHGLEGLRAIINSSSEATEIESKASDLAGTTGWDSLHELLSHLAISTNSVVLRGFERLPDLDPGLVEEIDVLCEDLPGFLAAVNAYLADPVQKPYKAMVKVAGHEIRIDARYVGDGYYDAVWQKDILRHQLVHNDIVGRPRQDDYFFSLLYHAKLQKLELSEEYIERLPQFAASIGLDWISSDDIISNASAAAILTGYMKANGYRYTAPVDRGVASNAPFMKLMVDVMPPPSHLRQRIGETTLRFLKRLTPERLRRMAPLRWKTRIAKLLRP